MAIHCSSSPISDRVINYGGPDENKNRYRTEATTFGNDTHGESSAVKSNGDQGTRFERRNKNKAYLIVAYVS